MRLTAFTGAFALFLGGCSAGMSDDDYYASIEESDRQLAARIESAERAVELLGPDHPWAGEYYFGNGLSANVSLVVYPADFVWTWDGCLGRYGANYGTAVVEGDTLRLRDELVYPDEDGDGDADSGETIPTDYSIVRWGERTYLIGTDQFAAFVNAINNGSEPRNSIYGRFFLRRGDEERMATGDPSLPPEYAIQILDDPIIGSVTRLCAFARTESNGIAEHETTVLLDVGEEHGVWPGMELEEVAGSRELEVVRVERSQCFAVIRAYDERPRIEVGDMFITGPAPASAESFD